jgi:hypothetical protein
MTFAEYVQVQLHNAEDKLKNFKPDWWALSGCDDVFLAAQRVHIARDVLRSLEDAAKKGQAEKRRVALLYRHLSKQHRDKACWPKRSTSITANLSDQCELTAISEMLNMMDQFRTDEMSSGSVPDIIVSFAP